MEERIVMVDEAGELGVGFVVVVIAVICVVVVEFLFFSSESPCAGCSCPSPPPSSLSSTLLNPCSLGHFCCDGCIPSPLELKEAPTSVCWWCSV